MKIYGQVWQLLRALSLISLTLIWLASFVTTIDAAPATRFVSPSGSGASCSQLTPCTMSTALGASNNGDGIYFASGTFTGTGTAVITLTKSITLYGGWDGTTTFPVVRNPILYQSQLDGQMKRRVIYIAGDITPTVDGFIITNGNATGLTQDCPGGSQDGCGGGISVAFAHPIISNNIITNNVTAVTTTSSIDIAYGGGISLESADRALIFGNSVISNTAGVAGNGDGGGMVVDGSSSGVQVRNNNFLNNYASRADTFSAWGGGISVQYYVSATVQGNSFQGNHTSGSPAKGRGAGIYGLSADVNILNNEVVWNYGDTAVDVQYVSTPISANRIVDNFTASGLRLRSGSGVNVTIANNVVARSGFDTVWLEDTSTEPLTTTFINNTIVGSNTGVGVFAGFVVSKLWLTNTIVANHTWGIQNYYPFSGTIWADHTLFYSDTTNVLAGVTNTNALVGDPLFVDAASGNFHISAGSAAIDVGINAGVTKDIDGDARPIGLGYDIGADEFRLLRWFIPIVMRR